jgi:hypothetical protein
MSNHNLREKKRLQDFLLEKYSSRSGKPIVTLVKKAETPSFDPLRRVMRLYVSLYEEAERLTGRIEKLEKRADDVDFANLSEMQRRTMNLLAAAIAAHNTTDKDNLAQLKGEYQKLLDNLRDELSKYLNLPKNHRELYTAIHDLDWHVRNVASKLGSGNEEEFKKAIEGLKTHTQLLDKLVQNPSSAQQTLENFVNLHYGGHEETQPLIDKPVWWYYKELAFPEQPQQQSKVHEIYHKPVISNLPEDEKEKIYNARHLLVKNLIQGNSNEVKELLTTPRSTDIKYPYPEGLPWHGWALGIGAGLLGLMGLLDLFQRRKKTPGLIMTLAALLGLAAWGLHYKPKSLFGFNLDPMWRALQKNYPSIFNLFGSSDQKATP